MKRRYPAPYYEGYEARENSKPLSDCPHGFYHTRPNGLHVPMAEEKQFEMIHWWKGGWHDRDRGLAA